MAEAKFKYRRVNSRAVVVDLGKRTIGTVWRGCGTTWAGSRYASGIEATGSTRIEVAKKLAAMPKLYDRIIGIGEEVQA